MSHYLASLTSITNMKDFKDPFIHMAMKITEHQLN